MIQTRNIVLPPFLTFHKQAIKILLRWKQSCHEASNVLLHFQSNFRQTLWRASQRSPNNQIRCQHFLKQQMLVKKLLQPYWYHIPSSGVRTQNREQRRESRARDTLLILTAQGKNLFSIFRYQIMQKESKCWVILSSLKSGEEVGEISNDTSQQPKQQCGTNSARRISCLRRKGLHMRTT